MRDVMLIIHFLGLAMGVGTSIAFAILGASANKMEKQEGQDFMIKSFVLSRMGHLGLLLLLLSGGYLMTPYWQILGSSPILIAKLSLFVVLAALIGIMSAAARKAKSGDPEVHLKKTERLGPFTMVVAVTIVVLAVLQFH